MIEIHGKRNSAVVYADKIDKETKTALAALLRDEANADAKIRIMPDCHLSRNAVVGTTMTLSGRVNPSILGVDLGCGMEVAYLDAKEIDFPKLDEAVHTLIPCGAKIHPEPAAVFDRLDTLRCISAVDRDRAQRSIGTLGGGNHFIEVDRDASGRYILVIHSGSRGLGSDAARYYQDQAYRQTVKKLRKNHRSERRYDDDGYRMKSVRREERSAPKVRTETAVLEGALFDDYLNDLAVVTDFADLNRRTMAERICGAMNWNITDRFSCVHNDIDDHGILRKGAISARQGERVIIPLNMRDGAVLGVGLGNPEWNFSAPHGAGRVCSRNDARHAYTTDEFLASMTGIYTTTAAQGSLDECPMAYKAPEKILGFLGDTVDVCEIIRPVYNFKAL